MVSALECLCFVSIGIQDDVMTQRLTQTKVCFSLLCDDCRKSAQNCY